MRACTLLLNRNPSFLVVLTVFFTACGGDNSDTAFENSAENTTLNIDRRCNPDSTGIDGAPLDAPLCWTLGPATYGEGAIALQRNARGRTMLSVTTPRNDTSNGDYAGSTVTLLLSGNGISNGDGSSNYTVVDTISRYPDTGTAFIVVTAGTEREPLASSRWASSTGLIAVKADLQIVDDGSENDGSYGVLHVSTIEPLMLTRDFVQGTGVPNSPEHISFEMQNLHGQDLCGPDGRWC